LIKASLKATTRFVLNLKVAKLEGNRGYPLEFLFTNDYLLGTFEAKCLPLKKPLCKSKGLMKMKARTTLKVKMEVTYIHNKVVMASKNFHMLQTKHDGCVC
jgi:hypothetical protein